MIVYSIFFNEINKFAFGDRSLNPELNLLFSKNK